MTTPDPLDGILMPFSVLWKPSSASFHYMPLSRGKTTGAFHAAAVTESAILVHGQWSGNHRARLRFSPAAGVPVSTVIDMPTTSSGVTVIPPTLLAATGPGAYLAVDVYAYTWTPEETSELLLNVLPTPYSS